MILKKEKNQRNERPFMDIIKKYYHLIFLVPIYYLVLSDANNPNQFWKETYLFNIRELKSLYPIVQIIVECPIIASTNYEELNNITKQLYIKFLN